MNIGINGFEAVVPRFGFNKSGIPNRVGSSEYCFKLLKYLERIDRENNYVVFLPKSPTSDLPSESINWHYEVFKVIKFWTLWGLSKKIIRNKSKLNVFFSPTHYLPINLSTPAVISILDVSYVKYPELFTKKDLYKLKIWGKYSVSKADKILTISQSSKSDIIKTYGISGTKISVVYPGVREESVNYLSMESLLKKFNINKEYILFVGTLQPRKNIKKLIEAFSKIETNADLVIVGRKGWMYEDILSAPQEMGIENRVKFIHDATDDDLPSFYKYAKFFILPSLYEGFGLPILEAMKNGCPVITSDTSSMPEAGGDASLYIDPNDTEDISKKMKNLLEDDKLREDLIKKGYVQVKKFSWEKSARETLAILDEVGKK